MKCLHCRGNMQRKTAPFHIDRKGYHLTLDAIPAWICTQCGEPYFDEAEVQAIQDLIRVVEDRTGALAASQ